MAIHRTCSRARSSACQWRAPGPALAPPGTTEHGGRLDPPAAPTCRLPWSANMGRVVVRWRRLAGLDLDWMPVGPAGRTHPPRARPLVVVAIGDACWRPGLTLSRWNCCWQWSECVSDEQGSDTCRRRAARGSFRATRNPCWPMVGFGRALPCLRHTEHARRFKRQGQEGQGSWVVGRAPSCTKRIDRPSQERYAQPDLEGSISNRFQTNKPFRRE